MTDVHFPSSAVRNDELFRIRSFHQSAFDVAHLHLYRVCDAVGPRNAGEYFLGCLSEPSHLVAQDIDFNVLTQ